MTRPATQNPAAPALAPPTPAAPPAGAAAAGLPRFVVRRVQVTEKRWEVIFACAACTYPDFVDEATELCRPCWRIYTLAPAAMNEGGR